MKHFKNIFEILNSWGAGKREVPPNNEALKKQVLSKVPESLPVFATEFPKKSPYMLWLSFSFAAAAVAVVLVNVNGGVGNLYRQSDSTSSGGTGVATESGMAPQDGVLLFQSTDDSDEQSSPSSAAYKSETFANNGVSINSAPAPDSYRSISPMPPYYAKGTPISDTREFLKQSYYASLKTREVEELQNRVEIMVRGVGGRVDSSSSGEEGGYVRFAIPLDRLEAFRMGIKDLAGARFYEEQMGSDNLLPQKQNIEERQEITQKNIQKEDQNLLESVATVNGSISLTKINLWEFFDAYVFGPLLAWILLLAAGFFYFWHRKNSRINYDY